MAIIKPFKTPQGVIATYHKVVNAAFDCNLGFVTMTVAIYASPEAREEGSSVLWNEYVTIPFGDLTEDPRDSFYALLSSWGKSALRGGESDHPVNAEAAVMEVTALAAELPVLDVKPEPEPEPAVPAALDSSDPRHPANV